ncbi:unnamed protein product, partial [Owenia fusiformis]
ADSIGIPDIREDLDQAKSAIETIDNKMNILTEDVSSLKQDLRMVLNILQRTNIVGLGGSNSPRGPGGSGSPEEGYGDKGSSPHAKLSPQFFLPTAQDSQPTQGQEGDLGSPVGPQPTRRGSREPSIAPLVEEEEDILSSSSNTELNNTPSIRQRSESATTESLHSNTNSPTGSLKSNTSNQHKAHPWGAQSGGTSPGVQVGPLNTRNLLQRPHSATDVNIDVEKQIPKHSGPRRRSAPHESSPGLEGRNSSIEHIVDVEKLAAIRKVMETTDL